VHSGAPLEVELALFAATSRGAVFAGPPLVNRRARPATRAALLGLQQDQDYSSAWASAHGPAEPFTPAGPLLPRTPRPITYVDPAADGAGDGSSAQSPLNDLTLAVLNPS
jgi:hypothetical protein